MAYTVNYVKTFIDSNKKVNACFRSGDESEARRHYEYLQTLSKNNPAIDTLTGEKWYVE